MRSSDPHCFNRLQSIQVLFSLRFSGIIIIITLIVCSLMQNLNNGNVMVTRNSASMSYLLW